MRDHPPQAAAENVVALPFFLTKNGQKTLLVQNNSVLPYVSDDWYTLTAKYRMPVCVYYHCDFVYESDEEARRNLAFLSDFQWANGYNFNREDQMMLASAAAYHQVVNASGNLLGEAGITINPASGETEFPSMTPMSSGLWGCALPWPRVSTRTASPWRRTCGLRRRGPSWWG